MSKFDFLGSFLGARNQVSKDGHDMSNQEVFSVPFAVNVPLKSYSFVPGEHYKFRVGGAVQTSPMREDNFAQLFGNLKAVAVPLSSVMRNYMQLLPSSERPTRKDPLFPDPAQLMVDIKNPICIATVSYIYSKLVESFIQSYTDYSSLVFRWESEQLVFYKGNPGTSQPYSYDQIRAEVPDTDLGALKFLEMLKYSKPFDDYIYFDQFLYSFSELCSISGCPLYMDILRLLDNLGYGNFYPVVDSIYQSFISTSFGNYVQWMNFQFTQQGDQHFSNVQVDFFINATNIQQFVIYFNRFSQNVDILPILCYQYYVYSTEKTNYRNPSTVLLTADYILSEFDHGGSGFNDSFVSESNRTVLRLTNIIAQTSYLKDFFEFMRQYTASIGDLLPNGEIAPIYYYLFMLSNPLLAADVYTSSQLSVVSGSIPGTASIDLTSNLVKAYAETSALYSLRQSLLRGGATRKGQMEALFGVSGAMNTFEPVQILDASRSSIDITGLMNQAETEAAPLGTRGARGDGRFGLEFTYDSKDYGYLFIVNFFTTSMFYENFMCKREYMLSHNSWWMPQFNHLGLEPIRSSQLCFMNSPVDPSLDTSTDRWQALFSWSNSTVGYTARNYELKQEVNKVHGLFTNFGFASYNGVSDMISKRYLPKDFVQGNAAFGGYVPTLIDQQVKQFAYEDDLYFKPDQVNNLFVNMVSGSLFGDYSQDHFKLAFNFSCHKVSPMPKLGLFKLDI